MTETLPPLTYPQERTFAFICDYIEEHGYPPVVREIAAELGVTSTSTAQCHLRALHKKGYIEVMGKPRAIKVNRSVTGR